MRLQIGDEFRDPAPSTSSARAGHEPGKSTRDRPAYRVTGIVKETAWYGLYEGKKLFTNYHFGKRILEEAGEQEGLDVFLKTVHYRALDDRESIKDLREQALFEMQRVLGRSRRTRGADDKQGPVLGQPLSNLLPEPIDYLRVPNERDAFALANVRQLAMYEPILVFERVHGIPLDRWLSEHQPALLRRLEVLASLLDFLAVLHTEGLLANGIEPESIWIDESDRLHYLGSDMIIDATRQKKQRRLYLPERYPTGYAPVEAFDPEQDIAGGTDLYNWATLAYFLITSDSPAEIARQQGKPFARFEDSHFDRVQRDLQRLPAPALPRIQQAFRIAGSRFVHTWPESFVGVLRECLLPKLAQRPGTREALSGLWSTAKPRAVPAALAVYNGKYVEILLAARDMEPGLEMVIRRAAGFVPRHAQEGQLIAQGALAVRALDQAPLPRESGPSSRTPAPLPCYAIFTRVRADGEPVYSAPVAALFLDLAQPAALVNFAEEVAQGAEPGGLADRPGLPDRVALLEELADTLPVARAWLGSARPLVRRWALHLLEGQLRTNISREAALTLLLERCVAEDHPDLRQAALRALFQGERRPDPALVVRVGLVLGQRDVDSAIRAVKELASIGLAADVLATATQALERERLSPCPECQAPIRELDREEHLRSRHGYVALDGSLMSYGEALRTLWRRLVAEQAESAAVQLAGLFVERHGDRAASAYGTAFAAQLQQHAAALGPPGPEEAPQPAWERLGKCLAAHELTQRVCRDLLGSRDARLRQLARLALVPLVAGRLTGQQRSGGSPSSGRASAARQQESVAEFRTSLEALCAQEDFATRLVVCQRLQAAGAPARAAHAIIKELEQDREVPCPHCQALVRRRDESAHLRQVHGIYSIGGQYVPWEEALRHLAVEMLAAQPSRESAATFVQVASDRLAESEVASRLAAVIVQAHQERNAVPDLSAVAGLPHASEVMLRLLDQQPALALALFNAIGNQASLTLLERVVPVLGQAGTAPERKRALEIILGSRNAEAGTRERALEAVVGGMADPLAVMRLLEELERSAGRSPLIEARRQRVLVTASLPCPACQTVLTLAQLQEHAWQAHRLVLEAGTWYETWELIEAWLRAYQSNNDERLIERAVELAQRADGQAGMERLGRLAAQLRVRHARLPRRRWLDEHQVGQLKTLAWVAGSLLALLMLVWLLWRR